MELRPGLTKENFFDEAYRKYPKAVQIFCNWIDEYKKAVEWDKMFDLKLGKEDERWDSGFEVYKFHDIPYAMQEGIWIEFVSQQNGVRFNQYFSLSKSLEENMTEWFADKDFQNI